MKRGSEKEEERETEVEKENRVNRVRVFNSRGERQREKER